MPTWPRTIAPVDAGKPDWSEGLRNRGPSGYVSTRNVAQAGVWWAEVYPLLKAGRVDDEALMALMDEAVLRRTIYDVTHPLLPGSGLAPNGTGTGGVLVDGATQSGDTILTDGWPVSTSNCVRAGDWIAIAGLNKRFKVTADANSDGGGHVTIPIAPSIWVGEEPVDNAAVTTTGVTFRCSIRTISKANRSRSPDFFAGVEIVWEERL